MNKFFYILVLSGFLLTGCKSYKKTTYTETKQINKNKLLRRIKASQFKAKTLDSRIALSYRDQNKDISGNGRLRILKDSIIWGSLNFLGIPVVKFYITPNRIQYYNKIDQTYYDGNFELLQDQLGIPIDFVNLQRLLTGDLITDISSENTDLKIFKNYYTLIPGNAYLNTAKITPFYKILSETLSKTPQHKITIDYADYQSFKKENLPKSILIKTADKILKLHLKNISLNKELHFPFKLPKSYKAIDF